MEKTSTAVLLCASIFLFLYWFRYACRLILSAKTPQDYAYNAARVNRLAFVGVRTALQLESAPDLARLTQALDRDYAFLTYLLEHGAYTTSLEHRILRIDYRVMKAWCSSTRRWAPDAARRAMGEMTSVLAHLANRVGEQAAEVS